MTTLTATRSDAAQLAAYVVGEGDTRPWGSYVVTAVGTTPDGEEFCEKDITVNGGQILSLQSHRHRRERWTVIKGTLTVLLNDQELTLKEGRSINIPQGALHCMANLTNDDCIVHEIQLGLCREDDIARYVDAYGRAMDENVADNPRLNDSVALYKDVMQKISQ